MTICGVESFDLEENLRSSLEDILIEIEGSLYDEKLLLRLVQSNKTTLTQIRAVFVDLDPALSCCRLFPNNTAHNLFQRCQNISDERNYS